MSLVNGYSTICLARGPLCHLNYNNSDKYIVKNLMTISVYDNKFDVISLGVYIRQTFYLYRTEMTFTPTSSLAGSVDADEIEQRFEGRVTDRVAKKVACMFWVIMILLVVWSLLMCFLLCVLYNHKFHVTVVVNKTITMVANCSGNVTEEYITLKEHNIQMKEVMNEASFGIVSGFFMAAAATVGNVSSP